MPASGGETTLAVAPPRGVYTNLAIAPRAQNPVIVANWSSAINPAEIVRINPAAASHTRADGRSPTARAAELDWESPEHFWFTNSRGRRIHNMIVRPPAFDPSRKYPLLVEIHGGAATMWRDQITLRWNYHLLAQPRLRRPADQLHRFDAASARPSHARFSSIRSRVRPETSTKRPTRRSSRFPFIDATRQVAAGASYGGHLANWLEATTTRYKAIVSHAGVVNIEAQWGTSDGIYHRELMMGGPPWEQTQRVARSEPDPPRGELQDADPAVGRRKRLPRTDEQHARKLERAPAHEGAEPAARLAEREPLDLPTAKTAGISTTKCTRWLARWLGPGRFDQFHRETEPTSGGYAHETSVTYDSRSIAIAAGLIVASQARPAAQTASLKGDFVKEWSGNKDTLVKIANAMPEDKFSFKPTPAQRRLRRRTSCTSRRST